MIARANLGRRGAERRGLGFRITRCFAPMLGVCVLMLPGAGCQQNSQKNFSTTFWNPLGLKLPFSPDVEPIRVGVVADGSDGWNISWDVRAWWDMQAKAPFSELRGALQATLNKPVQISALKPFQVAAHLESGRLDFALLTDAQLEEVKKDSKEFELVARAKLAGRTGLIVSKADSDIQSIKDVAGQRFSFGPRGDAVYHYATLAALQEQGITINDIQKEIIPIQTLQYHISAAESAKEIAFGLTTVGVIDKDEYEALSDTGATLLPPRPAKDQFRVLGATKMIALGPFVASKHCDSETVATVRRLLLEADHERPTMVASLGIASFTGDDE